MSTITAPTEVEKISVASQTKESKKQALIKQALAFLQTLGVETFRTPQGESFARIKVNEHVENWLIHSDTFRRWLEQEMYLMCGSFLPNSDIKDIRGHIDVGNATLMRSLARIFNKGELKVFLNPSSKGDPCYQQLLERFRKYFFENPIKTSSLVPI
jgi:hypothetical protein